MEIQNQLQVNTIEKIAKLHEDVNACMQTALVKAIEIGELLTEQRAASKHGEWEPWVESNLPFSSRTARNYMKLFKNKEALQEATSIKNAYKLLESPKTETVSDLKELVIDKEFSELLPPLPDWKLEILESLIIEHGCMNPICVWNNTILDGHQRYRICKKHNIPFETVEIKSVSDRDDAVIWMIENQLNRKNLSEDEEHELMTKRGITWN